MHLTRYPGVTTEEVPMTRHRPRQRRWFRHPRTSTARLRHEDHLAGLRLPEFTHVPRGLR
jgi:hypothetical protein